MGFEGRQYLYLKVNFDNLNCFLDCQNRCLDKQNWLKEYQNRFLDYHWFGNYRNKIQTIKIGLGTIGIGFQTIKIGSGTIEICFLDYENWFGTMKIVLGTIETGFAGKRPDLAGSVAALWRLPPRLLASPHGNGSVT